MTALNCGRVQPPCETPLAGAAMTRILATTPGSSGSSGRTDTKSFVFRFMPISLSRALFRDTGVSVEARLPVAGDFTMRPWHWLGRWVPTRWREGRSVYEGPRAVIVEPVLAWLETRDDRMAALVIVCGRMLARG